MSSQSGVDPHAQHANGQKAPPKKRKSLARELQTLVDNNGKRARRDLPKCPICERRIDPADWPYHYQQELSRLNEIGSDAYHDPLDKNKGKRGAAVVARQQLERSTGKRKLNMYEQTLDIIRKNRTARQEALRRIDMPTRPHENDASSLYEDVQICFICNERLHGDSDAINFHIDQCLANGPPPSSPSPVASSASSISGAADIGWQEYEWAGQTRVRATAMMEGGYRGAGFATANKEEDVDEDLDVEDDGAGQYGQSQYAECDIVVSDDENEDVSALREMVSGGIPRSSSSTAADAQE
ncbi:hypothetical protein EC973_002115 [Apophysomyces ossiformis]|uniref:E3 ubiquitin-protein ligase RNF220 middle domain-containing protein n=1 Tax=Apophysomyces ossiformis TaxID=679940 RepID=A0A8H7ELX7_9FUNG|nr:hypothetical protein EC973_002115 [Apophysomyces ossiformis]